MIGYLPMTGWNLSAGSVAKDSGQRKEKRKMGKVGRPKKVEVKVEEKVEEPVIEEVLDDGMPVVTEKSAEVQEAETAKQPDINNPDDANKTYAEINE